MFSVATKKLTDKLDELFVKVDAKAKDKTLNTLEDLERPPSQMDTSMSSINTSCFMNKTVTKHSKASLNSLCYKAPLILAQGQIKQYVRGSSQQKTSTEDGVNLNPIPEVKSEKKKAKSKDNVTMINAENLIINIT
jgi:hypothetical protein